jgi:tRNA A-37 threonylcarbamoyl transferase component Bud32
MPEVLKRVGRYDLIEVIGRGGAAVVYLAHQRDLQRHVALKELAPYQAADSTFAGRFVEESRLAGSMSHANVVTVHDYFEDGGVPYIAMEYLPHGSLRQYIGRLSTAQIAGVLEGVLAGLSHGEQHGIVHRDLKPENLLVAADGRVKIADFGVARAYNQAVTRAVVTVAGTTIGTPTYMSPEQAMGTTLTPATDLYSLGIVAWELLTGQVPFEETDTPVAVLYRHVHEPVPSVRTVAPDVDPDIADWLARMLEKRPEDRYQSADDAWVDLEDIVLELLGPRWRREARLVVDQGTRREDATLTPAEFEAVQAPETPADEPPSAPVPPPVGADPREPSAETVTGPGAAEPEATVAPRRRAERSHTTLLRIARRHRDPGPGEQSATPATLRRRLAVTGIVAAMVAAAAAGVVLAGSGNKAKPLPPGNGFTQATVRAAQHAQAVETATRKSLAKIVGTLAVARTRALTGLINAKTPSQQASDASAVEKAYVSAAKQVAPLVSTSSTAAQLASTLTDTAAAYGRLAAAAKAHNASRYNRARAAIRQAERKLQGEVGQL